MNFLPSLFCQSTALSSRAVDGHQMYSEGSVVGKALTIGIKISSTPPPIITGGQKVGNLASFSTSLANHSTLRPPRLKMQQDIRMLKQISCVRIIALCSSPSLVKSSPRTPENLWAEIRHPIKFNGILR